MAITPADIEQLTFSPSKHGYDTEEVDNFLDQLSGEVDAMLQKIADLKGRLTNTEQQLAASQSQVSELESELEVARSSAATMAAPAPAPAPVSTTSASERQISQVLIVAQQSADKLVADARENAESIRNEADQKAREVIRQALAEKQNELDEIDRLKSSREEFRAEYKKLLQHFMDDADSVFPSISATPEDKTQRSAYVPVSEPVPAPAPVPAVEPAVDANATVLQQPYGAAAPVTDASDFNDLD